MSVLAGTDGTITIGGSEVTPITDWTLETFANIDKYGANDTGGWKGGKSGVKDSNGSFNMKDKPSFDEGDEVALVLYDGQDIYTLATALIGRIRTVCDMNDGTIIARAITFEGTSAVVPTSGSYSA